MKILFLHGWHSVVGGVKPTHLQRAGHVISNPALDDYDFARALQTAQAEFDRFQPNVVVGSSRGGAIALNINTGQVPLVLLCPAWKNWGTANSLKPNAIVLHSPVDDVIPFEHSAELVARSGLPAETLIEVGSDHRLADDGSLAVMLWACELLGSGQNLPGLDSPDLTPALPANAGLSQAEGSYVCEACGEEIIIPLDVSEGASQTYVEDCPVCCRANTIHVHFGSDDSPQVWAEPEQDP